MKYFQFMGEIVTDGVGHWRTYGEKKNLLTQRPLRVGRGAQNKGIKVGLDAKWGGFKVWI